MYDFMLSPDSCRLILLKTAAAGKRSSFGVWQICALTRNQGRADSWLEKNLPPHKGMAKSPVIWFAARCGTF
jgi:hypothetical protein